MTVSEALARHPSARWVFAAYHLRSCGGCDRREDETLEEVAVEYAFPLDAFLRDLNNLLHS